MKSRSQRRNDLQRRKPSIEPRKKILIVCEGAKTEPNYFKGLRERLRLTSMEVKVYGEECDSAPINVVDYAILRLGRKRLSESPDFDSVWCVFDVEIPQAETLAVAINKAKAYQISVALTNPCFEYWYILHFEKTAHRMQSNDEVIKLLKRHIVNYSKSDRRVIDQLLPLIESAKTHARQVIVENCYGPDLRDCNPSTHVHLVVLELQRIADTPKYPL